VKESRICTPLLPPKLKVGVHVAPLAVSEAIASCCPQRKAVTVPSAAHSTGVNFANNLFNHVYDSVYICAGWLFCSDEEDWLYS
jgi:hypothetical protein